MYFTVGLTIRNLKFKFLLLHFLVRTAKAFFLTRAPRSMTIKRFFYYYTLMFSYFSSPYRKLKVFEWSQYCSCLFCYFSCGNYSLSGLLELFLMKLVSVILFTWYNNLKMLTVIF